MAGGPDFDIIIAEKWGAQGLEEHKKTRRQQAEETKRHIFEVALALLDRRAFEQIKVRDIVEAAQVSVGTFYNYYATKLDVYYETYQLADEYFEDVVAPALIQPTARERILYFFDEYARYSSEITDISLTKLLYNSNNKCFDRPSEQGIRRVLGEQVQQGLHVRHLDGMQLPAEQEQVFSDKVGVFRFDPAILGCFKLVRYGFLYLFDNLFVFPDTHVLSHFLQIFHREIVLFAIE